MAARFRMGVNGSPGEAQMLTFARSALLLGVASFVVGCGSAATPAPAPAPQAATYESRKAVPATLEVTKGTQVTWTNKDREAHTITSGTNRAKDGKIDSGSVAPNETFAFTFNEVGTFEYFCQFHPSMNGFTVVVK